MFNRESAALAGLFSLRASHETTLSEGGQIQTAAQPGGLSVGAGKSLATATIHAERHAPHPALSRRVAFATYFPHNSCAGCAA